MEQRCAVKSSLIFICWFSRERGQLREKDTEDTGQYGIVFNETTPEEAGRENYKLR